MNRGREALVGLVIVVGIAVAVMGTLWLQGVRLGERPTEVEALLRDVGQLAEGNAVKFRGVTIGKVSSISVEPGGDAVRLLLELDEGVTLSGDAVVLVAPESMFGDWQAEIATRSRYPRFDYYPVEEEGTLPGYALPDISRLTATANEISENLSVLTDRFDRAFNEETAENLRVAIQNFQEVSSALNTLIGQESTAMGETLENVRLASQEISAAAEAANVTFARVQGLMGDGSVDSLFTDAAAVARNLREVTAGLRNSSQRLNRTLTRADSAFARVDRVTEMIESGDGALGRLLTDSTLAVEAESVLRELNLLLADFRANPKRYVRLSIF